VQRKKFSEKKRHKQKKLFAKENAGKLKKKTQSQKKIFASVAEVASDSEEFQSEPSGGQTPPHQGVDISSSKFLVHTAK